MAADDGKLLDDGAAGFAALPAYVWAASCASAAAAAHRRAGIARAAAASERRAAMWLEETQGARVEDAGRERTGAEALTKREREVAT